MDWSLPFSDFFSSARDLDFLSLEIPDGAARELVAVEALAVAREARHYWGHHLFQVATEVSLGMMGDLEFLLAQLMDWSLSLQLVDKRLCLPSWPWAAQNLMMLAFAAPANLWRLCQPVGQLMLQFLPLESLPVAAQLWERLCLQPATPGTQQGPSEVM